MHCGSPSGPALISTDPSSFCHLRMASPLPMGGEEWGGRRRDGGREEGGPIPHSGHREPLRNQAHRAPAAKHDPGARVTPISNLHLLRIHHPAACYDAEGEGQGEGCCTAPPNSEGNFGHSLCHWSFVFCGVKIVRQRSPCACVCMCVPFFEVSMQRKISSHVSNNRIGSRAEEHVT